MNVGPYQIRQRPDATPPAGLAWVPTLQPDLGDDEDSYPGRARCAGPWSDCNRDAALDFLRTSRVVVEIGVAQTAGCNSISEELMTGKPPGCVYVGIDRADKRRFHDPANDVYILHNDSADTEPFARLLGEIGRSAIDLLLIDGWHSVDQCIADWAYSDWLADDGTILLHDVNHHPGPACLMAAIDVTQWHVENLCPDPADYGLGVIWRRRHD